MDRRAFLGKAAAVGAAASVTTTPEGWTPDMGNVTVPDPWPMDTTVQAAEVHSNVASFITGNYGKVGGVEILALAPEFAVKAFGVRLDERDLNQRDGINRDEYRGIFSWCHFCREYDFSPLVHFTNLGSICEQCMGLFRLEWVEDKISDSESRGFSVLIKGFDIRV